MSPADMPDFDKMSPEEMNEWLESLAKRQGATEGFTTEASVAIPEIDPDTVVIDEPGYVPFGEESSSRKSEPTPEPPHPQPEVIAGPVEPAVPVRETPASVPTPERQPASPPWDVERPAAAERPVEPPPSQSRPAPREVQPPEARPAPAASIPEVSPVQVPLPPATPTVPAAESVDAGALAWLESLAAEQGDDLFNLDLSGVSVADEPTPAAARGLDNPMTWLEDLARSQTGQEIPSLQLDRLEDEIEEGSEKIDPFASGANPVEWLETLARREGVDSSELTTGAGLNIPTPNLDAVEAEAYTPFSFDSPLSQPRIVDEDKTPVNPNDFLTTLAGDEGYSESGVLATAPLNEAEEFDDSLSLDSIQSAISGGTVTPDQMQFFLDQKAEELASNPDMLIFGDEDEEDAPLVAEIPDWLQDMRPSEPEVTAAPTAPLESLFEVQAENLEIPDWLRVADEEEHSGDISDIFADESEPEPVISAIGGMPDYSVEVDPNDPWVEAFDLEHEQGAQDIEVVPDWYDRNINDPDRIAAVDRQVPGEDVEEVLVAAPLPAESSLPLGQPQAVPAWLTGFEQTAVAAAVPTPAPVQETPFTSDMPDWLKDIEVPDDVPDWLVETFPDAEVVEEEPVVVEPEPEPVRVVPASVTPPRPAAQPAPKPAPARAAVVSDDEAMTKLQTARDLEQAGDLETSLTEYEGLIRANRAIDEVVEDLTQLLRSYRTVPAVYRVLGDGLMRQGKLQAALNTYREALNQL